MIIRDSFCSFWLKTLCCYPSSEPSRQDGSDEGSQHTVSFRNKKNYPELSSNTPSYLELCELYGLAVFCDIEQTGKTPLFNRAPDKKG